MGENRFWITVWVIAGAVLLCGIGMGIYSGYLNDQQDLKMAKKGLHKYKVERCSDVSIATEWHEAGWRDK